MFTRKRLLILGSVLLLLAAIPAILSRGPDFDLEMTREVPSPSTTEKLSGFVSDPALWVQWFHMTTEARLQAPDQVILTVVPKKKEWKKFEISLRVLENSPLAEGGRRLKIEFLSDSKQKIRPMFEALRWEVDVLPRSENRSLVRGSVFARTSSWRSRLFGRLSPRILLNQALYPDLIGLAEIEQDKSEPAIRLTM